jgi:hypothetical protein
MNGLAQVYAPAAKRHCLPDQEWGGSYRRNILTIQLMNFIDRLPERQQCRDDCAGAGAENEVKPFMQRARDCLDLLQHAERVEALSPASVQRKDAARFGSSDFGTIRMHALVPPSPVKGGGRKSDSIEA